MIDFGDVVKVCQKGVPHRELVSFTNPSNSPTSASRRVAKLAKHGVGLGARGSLPPPQSSASSAGYSPGKIGQVQETLSAASRWLVSELDSVQTDLATLKALSELPNTLQRSAVEEFDSLVDELVQRTRGVIDSTRDDVSGYLLRVNEALSSAVSTN
jgi:hypothetical protein